MSLKRAIETFKDFEHLRRTKEKITCLRRMNTVTC